MGGCGWRAIVALGLVVVGLVDALVAVGSCLPPRVEVGRQTVGRGESVTVTGAGFGDNCYDSGPPPAGEGQLGRPLEGIEVVIAQATAEVVVARGAASSVSSSQTAMSIRTCQPEGRDDVLGRGRSPHGLTPQGVLHRSGPLRPARTAADPHALGEGMGVCRVRSRDMASCVGRWRPTRPARSRG